MSVAFWIVMLGLGLPAYCYVGYPLILFLAAAVVQAARDARFLVTRRERRSRTASRPFVSIIMAAYNEEDVIGQTLEQCIGVDYPSDRLEIIVGSDGSTDGTVEVAGRYQGAGVTVVAFPKRRGKLAVITDCAARANGEILLFTDANTRLSEEAVTRLVRHFKDPKVGVACGELRLRDPDADRVQEGTYWRYEVILKILESRTDSVLGANGAIYAVRKELFPELDSDLITEDFVIPMKIRARGYRVLYDPEAVATEPASPGMWHEFRRRMRIGAGNWQALWECKSLLLPWKGFVSLSFWSHKVLRWLTPFLLVIALAGNVLLLPSILWRSVLGVQLLFYACALAGGVLASLEISIRPLRLATYFVVINAALGIGLVRGMLGLQRPTWRRTARGPVPSEGNR